MRLTSLLREPLLHFLAVGLAIFLLSMAIGEKKESDSVSTIVVTEGRLSQLIEGFERTWGRLPSSAELDALTQDFVREEIYYREAVKLGMDRDDTIVRRRMRQKMEFLATLQAESAEPDDEGLESFYQSHSALFREPPEIAFLQVFVSVEEHGEEAEALALTLLEELRSIGDAERPPEVGDPFILPPHFDLTPLEYVARTLGQEFADVAASLPVGVWQGPVTSAYGLHLVLITERKEGRLPALAEVRGAVEYEWRRAYEQRILQEQYESLAKKYRVVIEGAEEVR